MAELLSFAPENFIAAAGTNFPQYVNPMAGGAYRSALAFDTTTSEKCRSMAFTMPAFTGTLTLKVKFCIAATSGNVQFRAAVEAVTSGDAINMNTTTSFDTANSSGAVSVPASTYNPKVFSITLTNNDSVVAGDEATIALDRDVTVASDAAGDCYVTSVSLEDAS